MKSRIQSLASDTLIYGVFIIVGRFLTFMLTPFYTNYLTMQEVGLITTIFSFIAFLNIFYNFGMDSAFFRFFKSTEPDSARKSFSYSFFTITAVSIVFTLILTMFSGQISGALFGSNDDYQLIIIGAFIPLLDALILVPLGFLRMTNQAKKFSVIRFILIIITVSLNIFFVVGLRWGIFGVLFAQIISSFVGLIIFIPEIVKNLNIKIDKKMLKEMVMFGLPTIPANLSIIILEVIDRPLLLHYTNETQVAIYSINYRLCIPMMLTVLIYEYAWKPFYMNHFEDKDAKDLFARIFTYFTATCGVIFLICVFFTEYVILLPFFGGRLINPAYSEGLVILPLIMGAYFFSGLSYNFATGCNITKKMKYLPISVGAGAVINIISNIILIPAYGYIGAAWSTFIAYFVSSAILYYFSRKIYYINYNWFKVGSTLLFVVLSYFIVYFSVKEYNEYLIAVKFAVLIGYIIILFIFKIITKNELQSVYKLLLRRK